MKEKQKLKLKSEIRIHRSLNHPNIIRFRHAFEDKRFVYILMDLSEHHSLSEFLKRRKRFCELEVKYFLNQILVGVTYLHSQNIIHRDLKLGKSLN